MENHFIIIKDSLHDCLLWKWHIVAAILVMTSSGSGQSSSDMYGDLVQSGEFCQEDIFTAQCSPGHVILMTAAEYGRMKLGKCVRHDYGHLGCSDDARSMMDEACSGRRKCEFRIFDSKLRKLKACPDDIESFLMASYVCLPVITGTLSECTLEHHLAVTARSGYLPSLQAEEHLLGSLDCPWHLRASPGQTYVFHLLNFAPQTGTGHEQTHGCYELAVIRDGQSSRSITTCDGAIREIALYSSETNDVSVEMALPSALSSMGKFLIHFEVTGCPDIATPPNATLSREGNTIEIRCKHSPQTWTLVCKGNHWLGQTGNCSQESNAKWGIGKMFGEEKFPYGILIVVAIGVALGVFCGGLLLTCAAMYMKRRRQERARRAVPSHMDVDDAMITDDRIRVRIEDATLFHKQYSPYTGSDETTHIQCCDDSCLQNAENAKYKTGFSIKPTKEIPHKVIGTFPRTHVYESPRLV